MSQDRLTRLSRDQACQIRLDGCDGGGPTTVPCHFRDLSLGSGMALKPGNWCIAFGCFNCHEIVDGRRGSAFYTKDQIRLAHSIGVIRTFSLLIEQGAITIAKRREIA